MPICRNFRSTIATPPVHKPVQISHYVVRRRIPPRSANDNRRFQAVYAWHWAAAIAVGPTLTAVMLLSGLF